MLTDPLKALILEADVVSFDIFDTLLLRRHYAPSDVFAQAGGKKRRWFRYRRIAAEQIARFRHRDVTLEQIYAFLRHSAEHELRAEKETLFANRMMREVYDFAVANGKTIIAVSDMYLPQQFLRERIESAGYSGMERVYVSCEAGFSKGGGGLFLHVAKDLGIAPGKILHIGDNEFSDVVRAKEEGLRAWHLPSPRSRFEAAGSIHPEILRFLRRGRRSSHSLLLGIFRDGLTGHERDYWYRLGFSVAGPVVNAFVDSAPNRGSLESFPIGLEDEINQWLFGDATDCAEVLKLMFSAAGSIHDGALDFTRARRQYESDGHPVAITREDAATFIQAICRQPSADDIRHLGALRSATDHRHALGFHVLGPVLTTFARLLLEEAQRDGVTRLAFVARDGAFLRDVTARLIECLHWPSPPTLDYVYLSRLVTLLPQQMSFADLVLAEADSIFGARRTDVGALLRYYGIDAHLFDSILERHALTTTTVLKRADDVLPLLRDADFLTAVEEERARQKALLADYLGQTALLSDSRTALVDLGWRGSIPAALAGTFTDQLPRRGLLAYALGYWDERPFRPLPHCEIKGLLTDIRRGRTPLEGSAFYCAYILESVCRAAQGTVLGYSRDDRGAVVPVLAADSPQRQAERAGEDWREPIRQGVLDFIDEHAERYRTIRRKRARRDAQRRLFRLAFLPSEGEVRAVSRLTHTEGHAPDWVQPLVDPARPSPFLSPRRWVAGLASPWRSGYVKTTGGWPLALAFTAMEAVLLAFPSVRRGLRRVALKLGR